MERHANEAQYETTAPAGYDAAFYPLVPTAPSTQESANATTPESTTAPAEEAAGTET